jgi:hypothetical protein
MNDADAKVKQQIVEKIKSSTNILVTVSNNPSVDDLSAALGLTALLNKLDKHATAIFSGAIPPAITFLDPTKVFENTADSLRDFIIALDKEKADHLRYKVEGDVVKIFITPYHTTITSDDLEFSQGDFNVELVLALGVANQDSLDAALAAHGRILHEVTVATFSAGEQTSRLGSIDWRDESASGLCEMVTSISDALKTDKPLLDKQISTALLTGIVASTDRFSNTRTTSRVMTMAAQLMAAGADQQLIAARLQESHAINSLSAIPKDEKVEAPIVAEAVPIEPIVEQSTLPPDSLTINHGPDVSAEQVISSTLPVDNVSTIPDTTPVPPPELVKETTLPQPVFIDSTPSTSTIAPAYAPEPESEPEPEPEPSPPPEPPQAPQLPTEEIPQIQVSSVAASTVVEPSLGGTLNATADEAATEMRRELEDQQNKTILTHSYLGNADSIHDTPINSVGQSDDLKDVDIFSEGPMSDTANTFDLPMPPPLPDFSTLPPPTTISPLSSDIGAPVTAAELSTLSSLDTAPPTNDPGQFHIPGQ